MIHRSKHGLGANPKTRSNAERGKFFIVFLAWTLSILACSQGYVTNAQLTATAALVPTRAEAVLAVSPTAPPPTVIPTQAPTTLTASGAGDLRPSPLITQSIPTATSSPTPIPTITETVTPGPSPTPRPPILYYALAGDTLPVVAVRFGVKPSEITSPDAIPARGYIRPKQLLIIPAALDLETTAPQETLMPDSEVVFSPSAVSFDTPTFVNEAGGYLSHYREYLSTGWYNGAELINRVAIENSINPRLLLALLEYQSHWVYGQPRTLAETDYPLGLVDLNKKGLYKQLSWAVEQLSIGYYGWQAGLLTDLSFSNGVTIRLWPKANAGTAAVAYFFAHVYNSHDWANVVNSADLGIVPLYEKMFGNPWLRAESVEPLFPPDLTQPELQLPFPRGESWAFTGGPHSAWGPNGALAAVDFAPPSMSPGCIESTDYVTAAATGLVLRTGNGVVVLDLDGDGHEQTGWVLLYLHVASKDRIEPGTWLTVDDKIGHPSCEGGVATGTHVHLARKYNGQWMLADGPLPMVLSGWQVSAGDEPYQGTMTREGKIVTACTCGSFETRVLRP